jgi:hypothetical protein
MTSTTTVATTSVSYYFTATTSSCGVNVGTGGTDSGWQASASYTDTGLQANKCYGYMITSRDSNGNYGATSTASTTYTLAATPTAPTLSSVMGTTLVLTNNEGDNPTSNPSTSFTIYVSGTSPNDATWEGKYVTSAGAPSATPQWLSDSQLTSLTVTGLTGSTAYNFYSVARNQNSINSATSTATATTTLETTPPSPNPLYFSVAPTPASTSSILMTTVTATDAHGPVEYLFTSSSTVCGADAGTLGSSPEGQIDAENSYSTLTGTNDTDKFGYSVASAGDVNNDGYADLLVGAYQATDIGLQRGRAYLFYGPLTGSITAGTADVIFNGTDNLDIFGYSVASAGDVDNDGYADLLVGAYSATDAGTARGRAYLFYGSSSLSASIDAENADVIFNGTTDSDNFGYSVASAGDVDNDGYADLLVGAYTAEDAGTNRGRAYLFYGPLTGTTSVDAENADAIFNGTYDSDFFGSSVASAGDVNADGSTDLLFGAYNEDFEQVAIYPGAAHLFLGMGGSFSSGWQTSASYTHTGLSANKCYAYMVTARDALGTAGSTSTASSTYTLAATPTAPTLSSVAGTTLVLTNNENGNPTANPTTNFTMYVSGTSPNDTSWEGKYVNGSGAPSATPVWLSDAQLTSLTVTGLTDGTSYNFYAQARNQNSVLSGTSTATATTTLASAPTPNPVFFTTAPTPTSTSSISMTVVTATDVNAPVEYYFTATTSSCGANVGTGGTDSGWQAGTTYTDTGLQANKCYGYLVTARDALGNTGATSTASTTYTLSATPTAPTLTIVGTSTLVFTVNAGDNPTANPSTYFAVYVANTSPNDPTWEGQYVVASGLPEEVGLPVPLAAWGSSAQLTSLTIKDLNPDTSYTFYVVARNQNSINSATSSGTATTTIEATAPTPNPVFFTTAPTPASTSSISMTSVTATDVSSPVSYYFTATTSSCGANVGTGGTDSGWQSSVSYTDSGLQANKCYGYLVTARDALGNTGATSTASTTYTLAATPTAPTLATVSTSSLVFTNNENGNSTTNPATDFTVYVSGTSPNHASWEGKYVNASGQPSATPVWLSDAQLTALSVTGLTYNTSYSFYVQARNANSILSGTSTAAATTTLPDTTAPTPAPTFSSAPTPASTSSISMTTNVSADDNGPVEYYFTATTSSCGANVGTGGTDSGWQADTTHLDVGLQANKCYGYMVTARDSLGNKTSTSTASTTYTLAATPTAPTLASVTTSTLVITNNEGDNPIANPSTSFMVYVTTADAGWSNKYVASDGTANASPQWLSDVQLTALSVTGLTPNTAYTFYSVARNQNSVNSATSSGTATTTLEATAPTPNPVSFTTAPTPASTSSISMTSVTATDVSSPVSYYFTATTSSCGANVGTGGTDSGWQSSVSYTDSGLQANKCYGYMVTARDALGNTGATSTASTTYTLSATPTAPTLATVSTSTLVLTNNEGYNPIANPSTSFTVYVTTADAGWSNKYVASDGTANASPQWLTDAQLTALSVTGLTPNTAYTFYSVARNQNSINSATSSGTATTTAPLAGDTIPSIASALSQQFYFGQATTTLETITITEAVVPGITLGNDIRIKIATTTTNFRFHTSITTPTFGGTASGKVNSTVSYADGGATLVIDVTSSFASTDTLTVTGLQAGSFVAVSSAVSNLELHTDGNTAGAAAATDAQTVRITGALTLGDHSMGQVSNQFVLLSNGADTPLFAFELAPTGENTTISALVLDLSGIANIDTDNIQNIRLYRDLDNDEVLSAGDVAVGGTGALTVTSSTGTIVFSTSFLATTTQDYIVVSDISDVHYANRMLMELTTTGFTVTGVTSGVSPELLGSISSIQHRKGMPPVTGGTGNAGDNIGAAAPGGTVLRSGGGGGGGGSQSAVGDGEGSDGGGETIGNEPGFMAPTATGGLFNEWANGSNAYVSDNYRATTAGAGARQSYNNFNFTIPSGNTITGIAIKLETREYPLPTDGLTLIIDMSWNGGGLYTSTKATTFLDGSDLIYTLGNESDTWGRTWLPSEFDNTEFVIRVTHSATGDEAQLDALQVKVFHQATGGGGGGGDAI